MTQTSQTQNKVLLIIMDGWGLNKPYDGNAVHLANTPTYDKLWESPLTAKLEAAGEAVGLPAGQMGNSEVGHMTIGSGRINYQSLMLINKAIEDKSLYQNETLVKAMQHAKQNNTKLHITGLYSPGGVHSHFTHTDAVLKMAKDQGLNSDQVYLHIILDGRDVPPKSAEKDLQHLTKYLQELDFGQISTLSGRYYAMDRDTNWDRTDQAYNCMTKGQGEVKPDVLTALQDSYASDITDEFVKPCKISSADQGLVEENDAFIFVNFRTDRPRQLTQRLIEKGPKNLYLVTMTTYNEKFEVKVVFPEVKIDNTLAETLSKAGLNQLHVTETAKYAHLTFFLNGKYEEPFANEDRILIKTYSDIATHDEKPQMRAPEITAEILKAMKEEKHQFIITNFPNGDMVGHTGVIPAAVKSCEAVDQPLAQILPKAKEHGYQIIMIADHGNCEEMLDDQGGVLTAHTTNPVPFILVSDQYEKLTKTEGGLADVAPTVLTILGIDIPKEMTGDSLV